LPRAISPAAGGNKRAKIARGNLAGDNNGDDDDKYL
jgi:hypothetical protein